MKIQLPPCCTGGENGGPTKDCPHVAHPEKYKKINIAL